MMRMVFYPAFIGWALLGVWITTLKIRLNLIERKKDIINEKNKPPHCSYIFTCYPQLSYPHRIKTGMGNTMRSNGRIYVVVAVMLAILIGLILYLVRLDRKITKMERQ